MQTSWYLLNLIKYYQRIARCNPYTRYGLNGDKDALYIIVKLKELLHSWLVVTVYISNLFIFVFSKVLHNPSLANLSCAKQHQRLSILAFFPCQKLVIYLPLHNYLISNGFLCKDTLFR